ncbi:NADP-dependent oxidoreductase [Novosphingobium sp. BL-52-GroH]|uniref:NADP-dependent oxidoreductase n=1 Tax=Novosphingobium sp. BL-52-GroH TaxID=3349877 RepID=UPI00384E069B
MKAIVYDDYRGIAGMEMREMPVPHPGPGMALVKVRAAGVNPVDIAVADGALQHMIPLDFPVVAGSELSGTIAALGEGVTGWQVGDDVHALLGVAGAFADHAIVPASNLVSKPPAMSFTQAAALPVAAATAIAALDAGNVGEGTRVLIHAAAGGVGTVLVQMAKARGADVTAMASPANLAFVAALGADVVIDRTTTASRGVRDMDVVIDAYGPAAQDISWTMLAPGGALLSLVTDPSPQQAERHGVRAQRIFGNRDPETLRQADALFRSGQLMPQIERRFPLEQAMDALRLIESGKSRGKVILDIAKADAT